MGGQRGTVREQLLELAKLRTGVVDIDGVQVAVREVGALEFAGYGKLQKTDRLGATAALISNCVIGEDGKPAMSKEEAVELANSARVSMPIVQKILALSGFGVDEKEPDAG